VESKIDAAMNSCCPEGEKIDLAAFKMAFGREIAKAYALGYCDGWEKQEPKKIYV